MTTCTCVPARAHGRQIDQPRSKGAPLCLAVGVIAALAWQGRAVAQDGCRGKEQVSTKCSVRDDLARKVTVKLKKGVGDTEYTCVLDTGHRQSRTTSSKGKTKFKFRFPRNEQPACGTHAASVGIDDGGFEECASADVACECEVACQTMDVSGFVTQDELNLRHLREGEQIWRSDTTWIEWDGVSRWQGHRNDAGRVAFCDAPNGDPGEGPWDCPSWREWRGSQGGWVVVPARFECID